MPSFDAAPSNEIDFSKSVSEILMIPEGKKKSSATTISIAIDRLQSYFPLESTYDAAFDANYSKYSNNRRSHLVDLTPVNGEIELLYSTPASRIKVSDEGWLESLSDTATVGTVVELMKSWVTQLGYNYEELLAEYRNSLDEE